MVLEEAPGSAGVPEGAARSAELVLLSGRSEAALKAQAGRLREHLRTQGEARLVDVAYSLAISRSPMEHRVSVVARSLESLQEQLTAVAVGETAAGVVRGEVSGKRGKRAFLFTGQGAQEVGMGRGLYEEWPAFRAAFDRCVELFDRELERPLKEVMWSERGSEESRLLDQTEYTQPALFALEYAQYELWRSWGVSAEYVAGHSIGELVAACVSGVFSLEDGVSLCAARGRLMGALPAGGEMVSIGASEAVVSLALVGHEREVSIAAVNAPEQVVIAGEGSVVREIAAGFTARGVRTKGLTVSHAFHSPRMEGMLEEFRKVAEGVKYGSAGRGLISNVSGKVAGEEVCRAEYWVRHVREAVRFSDGVVALQESGVKTYVEVGPKGTLLGLVSECLGGEEKWLYASKRGGRSEAESILEALGGLVSQGYGVDWKGVFPGEYRRVELPTYAWQRERYWVSRQEAVRRGGEETGHPLLGERVAVAGSGAVYESLLDLKREPWLGEHRVGGRVLVAGAALAEWLRAAGAEESGSREVEVKGLVMERPVVVPEEGGQRVQVVLRPWSASTMLPWARLSSSK